MQIIWWAVFLLSASTLVLVLLRNRAAAAWLGTMGIHVVVAAVILYAINWLGQSYDFRIPLNVPSIAAIGALGIPGVMLLVALKVIFAP